VPSGIWTRSPAGVGLVSEQAANTSSAAKEENSREKQTRTPKNRLEMFMPSLLETLRYRSFFKNACSFYELKNLINLHLSREGKEEPTFMKAKAGR
jgi:hypothetical protein